MTNQDKLNPQTLGLELQVRRQRLIQIRAMVHSQASLLHESYTFEIDEADLGYCCDVVCDLLNRSIAVLHALSAPLAEGTAPADSSRLALAIEATRQQLFRAQAVLQSVTNLMRSHEFAKYEGNLKIVMEMIVENMGVQISALEPLSLGLPIPMS